MDSASAPEGLVAMEYIAAAQAKSEGEDTFKRWVELRARNEFLITTTKRLLFQCEELKRHLKEQEELYEARFGYFSKPKRHRRTAAQIDRLHQCPTCSKAYGSEGSLFQHIKIKHPMADSESATQAAK